MLASGISDGLKVLWILEEDKNSKKLQFEASLIVVHKRNTSQNMPIWDRKRSSLGILIVVRNKKILVIHSFPICSHIY